MELPKQQRIMSKKLSKLLKNTDGCAQHYICATALFLLSMLWHAFYVIIARGISALGHDREVVDGLSDTKKKFIFQLMSTVQLTGAKMYDTQIVIQSA